MSHDALRQTAFKFPFLFLPSKLPSNEKTETWSFCFFKTISRRFHTWVQVIAFQSKVLWREHWSFPQFEGRGRKSRACGVRCVKGKAGWKLENLVAVLTAKVSKNKHRMKFISEFTRPLNKETVWFVANSPLRLSGKNPTADYQRDWIQRQMQPLQPSLHLKSNRNTRPQPTAEDSDLSSGNMTKTSQMTNWMDTTT